MAVNQCAVCKEEGIIGRHDARLDNLERWQKDQNGHLKSIDAKLDSFNKWLMGLLGTMIVSLIILIANLLSMRG